MTWLLTETVARALERAQKDGLAPTAEQQAAFATRAQRDGKPTLRVADRVAEIHIIGVLTPEPSMLAAIFGGGNTAYIHIQEELAAAQADPNVGSAVLRINSPGGTVNGLFETLAAVEAFSKPLSVVAESACSAAYAIAAVAGPIEAANLAADFGSIGVASTHFVTDDIIEVTSTEAPKKRPDVRTPEGKAVMREYLDAVHDLFVDAIARGRRVSKSRVNADFGRGAVLLAGDAQRLGMIDRIAGSKPALRSVKTQQRATSGAQEGTRMDDLNTLRAQYPAACAALIAEGEAKERDRATAHLTMGQKSGDMKTAIAAIQDGSAMTQQLIATYMTAGMNRADMRTRQQESDDLNDILGGAAASSADPSDIGEAVCRRMLAERGKSFGEFSRK